MVVVGDACTDDSEEVVASFGDPRLRWHNRSVNSGSQGDPNNDGVGLSRGDFIAYLGHDDLWFPWHLSGLVDRILDGRDSLVCGLGALIHPTHPPIPVGPLARRSDYALKTIPPSCWIHRRDAFDRLGPWGDHRSLARPVDVDYLMKFLDAGDSIGFASRLSLVKFTSIMWGTYAKEAVRPQPAALARIQSDPEGYEREILTAILLASTTRLDPPELGPLAALIRAVARVRVRLLDAYGRERWPLHHMAVRRHQRVRDALRVRRGLDH